MNDDYRGSHIGTVSHRDESDSPSKTPVSGFQCQTSGEEKEGEATLKSDKKIHLINRPLVLE